MKRHIIKEDDMEEVKKQLQDAIRNIKNRSLALALKNIRKVDDILINAKEIEE